MQQMGHFSLARHLGDIMKPVIDENRQQTKMQEDFNFVLVPNFFPHWVFFVSTVASDSPDGGGIITIIIINSSSNIIINC